MTPVPGFVVDGGSLSYLGLARRDGARLADLRRPLAVALGLALEDRAFRCLLDRNLPYRVREEDRGLLDLLLAEHGETFSVVPPGAVAQEHLLQRAAAWGAAVVGADPLHRDPAYLDAYPWLGSPGRFLAVTERDGVLSCPSLAPRAYLDLDAFGLYDRLLAALP